MLPGPPTPHCFAFSGVNPKQQNKIKPTTQQATTGASSAIRSASAASSSLSARSHAAPILPIAALHNIVSSAIPMSFCCFQLSLLFLMPLPICRLPLAGHCTCALQESRTHKAQPPLCAKLSSISSFQIPVSGVHFIPPRALLIRPLLPPCGDRFPRVMACCAAAPNTRNAASACPALSPARLSMRHAAAVRCELLAGATSKHHLQLADQSALRILISSTPHQANPKAALSFSACAWGKRKVAHGPVVSSMTMRNLSFSPCTISM